MQLIIMYDADIASSQSLPVFGWQGTFECRAVGNAGMEPSDFCLASFREEALALQRQATPRSAGLFVSVHGTTHLA